MRELRYAINVTLDGCCHHEAGLPPDAESMAFWTAELGRADALLYGRTTYEMMQAAWRRPVTGGWPHWMGESAPLRRAHRRDAEARGVEHPHRRRLERRAGPR